VAIRNARETAQHEGWCMDWGNALGKALAAAFERRPFVAQAGLNVEDRGGKLEIEPPAAKSNLLALCLAASGYIKWRACGVTFASSRGYPLVRRDQSPLTSRAGRAGIFREGD
jgi:hypothetical protein